MFRELLQKATAANGGVVPPKLVMAVASEEPGIAYDVLIELFGELDQGMKDTLREMKPARGVSCPRSPAPEVHLTVPAFWETRKEPRRIPVSPPAIVSGGC